MKKPFSFHFHFITHNIDVLAKTTSKFPSPCGLYDTCSVICINSFPTFYFWAASVISFCFNLSFHFHFTLPPASKKPFHFIFTSFGFPHFISFSLHFLTPSEIRTLQIFFQRSLLRLVSSYDDMWTQGNGQTKKIPEIN